MNWLPNSLSTRLTLVLTIWTLVAVSITGLVISQIYRSNAESDFQQLLLAHTHNLMGAVDITPNGNLEGNPNLGDPRFMQPGSGWYWAVTKASAPTVPLMQSASLQGSSLTSASPDETPFGELFQRTYVATDADGRTTQRMEAQLFFGESDELHQVVIGADRQQFDRSIASFNTYLAVFLSLFGAGTIFVSLVMVRLGLKPLNDAADALVAMKHGEAEKVEGNFPNEIAPFVEATNDLLSANIAVTERARTQVGNLAHALKTPLAVVLNDARELKSDPGNRIEEQAIKMQSNIALYLDRARLAATRRSVSGHALVHPTVERLVGAMRKLYPDKSFQLQCNVPKVGFRGEREDLEDICGNLLENAARHGGDAIVVDVSIQNDKGMFSIGVSDNGEGIPTRKVQEVLKRGARLDESTPGSGLGLSIVEDIVADYGGSLELKNCEAGGLHAVVFLPMSRSTAALQ